MNILFKNEFVHLVLLSTYFVLDFVVGAGDTEKKDTVLPSRSSQSSGGNKYGDTNFKIIKIIRQLYKLLLKSNKLWVL